MAILKTDRSNLALEMVFKELDDCLWIHYEFRFLAGLEPLLAGAAPDMLKKVSYPGSTPGSFGAEDYQEDSFLPILRDAVTGSEPVQWQPTERDMVISFHPEWHCPFIPIWARNARAENPEIAMDQVRRDRKECNEGVLPDDTICVVVQTGYHEMEGDPCTGSGLALVLHPTRAELAGFYLALSAEYEAFATRERLKDRIREYSRWMADEDTKAEDFDETEHAAAAPAVEAEDAATVAAKHRLALILAPREPRVERWKAIPRTPVTMDDVVQPWLKRLLEDAQAGREVDIRYGSGATPGRRRKIVPRGLFRVEGSEALYLEAMDVEKNDLRTFRVEWLNVLDGRRSHRLPIRHGSRPTR